MRSPQSKPAPIWRVLVYLLGAIGFTLAVLILATMFSDSPGYAAVFAAAMVAGSVAGTVIHELGHLAGALATRSRIHEVAIFARPATRARRLFGLRVRIGFLGKENHVATFPAADASALRLRLVVIYLSGPVPGVVAGAALIALSLGVASVTLQGIVLGLAIGLGLPSLASLFPVEVRGRPTDSLMLARLLFRSRGLRTSLAVADLRWRGRDPANRWRTYEELRGAREAMEAKASEPPI